MNPSTQQPRPPFVPPGRTPLHRFLLGFRYAWNGLVDAAVTQRNMRVHLVLGIAASAFAACLPVSGGERAVLLLFVVLVPAAEAANTALEALVDLASPAWHPRARVAKDAAAGVVLALAAGSVLAFLAIAGRLAAATAGGDATLVARGILVAGWAGGTAALAAAALLGAWPRPRAADEAIAAAGLVAIAAVAALSPVRPAALAGALAALALLALARAAALRRREAS